jgi:glycosyltransferase involved in cell wall biosynthesis
MIAMMQGGPRVSIVMTAYNDLRFIDAAVISLLRQAYTDFELIIVDDGTKRPEIFLRLAALDPRVRVITLDRNIGMAAAANRGIAESSGDIIARFDADDIAEPHRLAQQIELLDSNPELGLVGSWATWMNEEGEPLNLWRLPVTDLEIRWTILFKCPFCHSSAVYRRGCFNRAGGYNTDPAIGGSADHDLWWRMLDHCRAQSIPEPLVRYRQNPRGLSANYPPNWRQSTEPQRRRAWARLGVEYDAELIPHLAGFVSGFNISDPTLRPSAYRILLRLLSRFLTVQRLSRDDDLAEARRLKSAIGRRVLADLTIGVVDCVQLWPLCLRLIPTAEMPGLAKSVGRRLSQRRRQSS